MNTFNCKICTVEVSVDSPVHVCLPDATHSKRTKKGAVIIYLMNRSMGKNNEPAYRKRFGSRSARHA